MCDTIMIPLRAAMPKTLMNPMSEATERIPPDRYTPTTPPIMANGRLIMIKSVSRTDRNTMCRRKPNTPRPTLLLDGVPIPITGELPLGEETTKKGKRKAIKNTEKGLGFTLGQAIQGTRSYKNRFKTKTEIAIARLESMNIHNGEKVRPIRTEKYYKSTVLVVMKANLTAHQLDTDKGG